MEKKKASVEISEGAEKHPAFELLKAHLEKYERFEADELMVQIWCSEKLLGAEEMQPVFDALENMLGDSYTSKPNPENEEDENSQYWTTFFGDTSEEKGISVTIRWK